MNMKNNNCIHQKPGNTLFEKESQEFGKCIADSALKLNTIQLLTYIEVDIECYYIIYK